MCRRDRRQRVGGRASKIYLIRHKVSSLEARRGFADAGARCGILFEAGCSLTFWTTPRNTHPADTPRSRSGVCGTGIQVTLQIIDEGDGIPPARAGEHIRQNSIARQKGRPCPARHRSRARDFPRLCRGHAWQHFRLTIVGIGAAPCWTIRLPIPAATDALDNRRMSAATDQGFWSSTTSRRSVNCCGWGLTHARLRDTGSLQRQERHSNCWPRIPPLIILDPRALPDIQGHELPAHDPWAQPTSVPIVVLSSRRRRGPARSRHSIWGADDYLTKPFRDG